MIDVDGTLDLFKSLGWGRFCDALNVQFPHALEGNMPELGVIFETGIGGGLREIL